ncbi:alanine racemase, partial [Pseudomonas aeruginosa]
MHHAPEVVGDDQLQLGRLEEALRCAEALAAEADGFAVACIEEGLELREAGIRQPILLLEGFFEASELELIVAHDFWCVVHC